MKRVRSLVWAFAVCGLAAAVADAQTTGGYPITGRYAAPALLPLPEMSGPWMQSTVTPVSGVAGSGSAVQAAPAVTYVTPSTSYVAARGTPSVQPSTRPSSALSAPSFPHVAYNRASQEEVPAGSPGIAPPPVPVGAPTPAPVVEPMMSGMPNTAPSVYEEAAAGGWGGDCECCDGRGCSIYIQADALYWDRVSTGCDEVVVINTGLPTGSDTVLSTDDLDFDYEPGVRVLVGFVPDPCLCPHCSAWEASYFGVFDWSDSITAVGAGNLAIPGDLGLVSNNFSGADEIGLHYDSELHNFELNCVHSCCKCWGSIDFLGGARYISLDERFSIVGTDIQEGTSSYDINTSNDLFGFQLGGRLRRHWCRWGLELVGKAGVFWNDAEQGQIVTDSPFVSVPFVLRSQRGADEDTVAGLGELSATLIRPINDVWAFRMGYSALTIGGVALAPDQLDFTNTATSGTRLEDDGFVFVHGGHFGLEARW